MTLIKAKSKKHFNSMMDFDLDLFNYAITDLEYICDNEGIYVLYNGLIWDTGCLYMGELEDRMATNKYTK